MILLLCLYPADGFRSVLKSAARGTPSARLSGYLLLCDDFIWNSGFKSTFFSRRRAPGRNPLPFPPVRIRPLDLNYQQQIFSLIREWLKQPGRAVMSVVHDLSLARRYGTHAILMDRGKSISQGPVGDVMTPENLRQVYGMDVYAWMREMLSQWQE